MNVLESVKHAVLSSSDSSLAESVSNSIKLKLYNLNVI